MLKENKIPYKEVNVFENDNLHELLRLGGKPQTPFLVDGEVKLYESEEIIKYAAATYTHARKKRRTRVGKKR
jgi:glutathione S-transferase